MAALRQVPVEEYLKTVYRPDRDYVDGVVEERNLGELDHGLVQTRLAHFFLGVYKQTGILPVTELRIRISANRYRIPDVTICRGKPDEQFLTRPPLLCIEILSPQDRLTSLNRRVQEYLEFGVPAVWVIDPADKVIWIYRSNGMQPVKSGSVNVDGTSLEVPFSEIFD